MLRHVVRLLGLGFGLVVLCLLYGFFIEPRRLVIRQVSIGEGKQHIKIVLFSDIHIGGVHVDDARVKSISETVNDLSPDMVIMAGDYISGHGVRASRSEAFNQMVLNGFDNLALLSAPMGVYAAQGNHDAWYDKGFVEGELTRRGITVLENRTKYILGGLCLVGLADKDTGRTNPRVFDNCVKGARIISVMHSPDSFSILPPDTILAMAGHTHGGQINLPFIGRAVTATRLGKPYAYGLKKWKSTPVFITAGIGTSKMPARFRAPPEIVMIDLAYDVDPALLSLEEN
ncbi:MAG: metallophosphoesterase [Maricaulaceae bacterium]